MTNNFTENFSRHINFIYSSFDRIILRGYITSLFVEGSVINLLRNLGFKNHSNGILKLLTDQLNSHIKKLADKEDISIHFCLPEAVESKSDFLISKLVKYIDKS